MAVNDWFRLSVIFQDFAGTNTAMNTLAFQQGNALILDEEGEDLIGAYRDQIEPLYLPLVSGQYYLRQYIVRGLTNPSYLFELSGIDIQGAAVGDGLPSPNAAVVTLRTGIAGRRNRGRSYLVPTSEGAQANGGLSGAYTGAVSNMYDAMQPMGGGLEFAEWHLGVWSDLNANGRRVTSTLVRTLMGTQRRRRIGVGS